MILCSDSLTCAGCCYNLFLHLNSFLNLCVARFFGDDEVSPMLRPIFFGSIVYVSSSLKDRKMAEAAYSKALFKVHDPERSWEWFFEYKQDKKSYERIALTGKDALAYYYECFSKLGEMPAYKTDWQAKPWQSMVSMMGAVKQKLQRVMITREEFLDRLHAFVQREVDAEGKPVKRIVVSGS